MRLNFLFDFLRCQDHETFECLVVYLICGSLNSLFDFLAVIPLWDIYIYIHIQETLSSLICLVTETSRLISGKIMANVTLMNQESLKD